MSWETASTLPLRDVNRLLDLLDDEKKKAEKKPLPPPPKGMRREPVML